MSPGVVDSTGLTRLRNSAEEDEVKGLRDPLGVDQHSHTEMVTGIFLG